jgi:hypothetical protein
MARNQVLISMELYAKTLCSLCLCGELNRYVYSSYTLRRVLESPNRASA